MSAVTVVELLLILFIAVSFVAMVTSRLKIPYTVALVAAGIAIDIFHVPIQEVVGQGLQGPLLTPEVIFVLFLPGLLFESGINIDVRHLKENLWPILLLAVVGVAAATAITGWAVHWWLGIPVLVALLFGSLISATDPISVISLFRDLGVNRRLAVIVEGESLFNDGTAAVFFQVILAGALTGDLSLADGARSFLVVSLGGAALGLLVGYAASHLTSHVDEPRIEIMLSTIVAYGSYLLAEQLHVSGVIATVAAGLTVGNYGAIFGMSPRTRVAMWSFWEYFAFVINSLVFLLIGIEVHVTSMLANWLSILLATAAVLLGRMLVVYTLSPLAGRLGERIPFSWQHVFVWGGLHGSVSIALALSLPKSVGDRDLLLTMTFGVVAFSILAQGLTMRPLLRKLKLVEGESGRYDWLKGRQLALSAAQQELDVLLRNRQITPLVHDQLTKELHAATEKLEAGIKALQMESPGLAGEEARVARLRMAQAERSAVQRAVIEGVIPARAADELLGETSDRIDSLNRGTWVPEIAAGDGGDE